MATTVHRLLEASQIKTVLFSSWPSSQGLDAFGQYSYMKSDLLDRISERSLYNS